ncbi:c-type cytochrome [Azospirillum endophyticum]
MQLDKLFLPFSVAALCLTPIYGAYGNNGETLFVERCAMCHGPDAKGSGPLAGKSNPPTPDLTTPAFKKRLADYPGVIVSSIILRPNGDLIPGTLKENGYRLPPHAWTVKDFRDLNEYLSGVIHKSK